MPHSPCSIISILVVIYIWKVVTLGHLIGGTVLIETVFNIPGMGRMIVESIWRSEFFVMQGSILVIGVIVAVLNLIVDVLYTWLDPRIRVDR